MYVLEEKTNSDVFAEFKNIYVNGCFQQYVWTISQIECRKILHGMLNYCNGKIIHMSNRRWANEISRLILHAGWSYEISRDRKFNIKVRTNSHTPANQGPDAEEKYEDFKGRVYCLEVPSGYTSVFYARESITSPPCWTGNSSRSGQKGCVALKMRDGDMPFVGSTGEGLMCCLILMVSQPAEQLVHSTK